MIGDSFLDLVVIRIGIFMLQYTTPICLSCAAALVLTSGSSALSWPTTRILIGYSALDLLYAVLIWLPYTRRLQRAARHPPPLPQAERRALFYKCLRNIPDPERYLRGWFLGAETAEIRRENLREFILWAFFDCAPGQESEQDVAEMDEYIVAMEMRLGRAFKPGRGSAQCIRLTFDVVETRYRSFGWYVIMLGVDLYTHCLLSMRGFQYYSQATIQALSVIPPRPQALLAGNPSPSRELSYWFRPHTAMDKIPMVFLHGIGVGLWTHLNFLPMLNASTDGDSQIGIIALELLPVSFRLADAPLGKQEFLSEMGKILDAHGWDRFVLVSHSYGTALATHMIKSSTFGPRIRSTVLMDPISPLLHLPDIAHNFTKRKPKKANEWQLWYFASTDPGVALALGRHFHWKENIIWREELLGSGQDKNQAQAQAQAGVISGRGWRRVAVTLSGRDLIINVVPLAKYLTGGDDWVNSSGRDGVLSSNGVEARKSNNDSLTSEGIEVLWFPDLDHSQVFDAPGDQDRVCRLIRHYCTV